MFTYKIGWQAAIKFALAKKLEKLERNVDEPTYKRHESLTVGASVNLCQRPVDFYIMPPIPPIPPMSGIAGAAAASSGNSDTIASVVIINPATEPAA